MYAIVKHDYLNYINFQLSYDNSPRKALGVIKCRCADPHIITSTKCYFSNLTGKKDSRNNYRDLDREELFHVGALQKTEHCDLSAWREP